jgi:peroxiredoxin
MDTVALVNSQAPDRPRLSPAALIGVAILALITILLTWRSGVLETTLEQQDEQPALVGSPAPDFSALALDGRTVSLADFRGRKKVVVAFWASWCGPCRLEMPSLVKFYKENHSDSSDFELLAVSIDEDTKAAEGFAAVEKLMFPVLLDPRQKMASAYDVHGIPTMFVIDKAGKVIYGKAGYDMTMEFRLAGALGINPKTETGGADGNSSH